METIFGDFLGRTVVITGGATGIGAGIAAAFAKLEAQVVVTVMPGQESTEFEFHTVDVTDDDQVKTFAATLDQVDVLVNCAGMISRDAEFEIETFQRVLDVNLTGTMRMCTALKPALTRAGGSVVNIASLWSHFGGPRVPAYTASKGGVAQLTKSLAVAWAPQGIRVNAVAPGWIATNFTHAVRHDPEANRRILARTPAGRWGQPDDVAGAVIFLSSQAASFITGVILTVDGGYSAV